ncbi:MAG: histone [candidate division NC10 bacterium]|nr:histone [candidate division NC10 bacterium]
MVKKLVVTVMAVLFSLSVSGLGFAAEEKKSAAPAAPAAEKAAPVNPCEGGKGMTKKKAKKKVAKKKVKKDEGGVTMDPLPAEKK